MHSALEPAARMRRHLGEIATAVVERPELFRALTPVLACHHRGSGTATSVSRLPSSRVRWTGCGTTRTAFTLLRGRL